MGSGSIILLIVGILVFNAALFWVVYTWLHRKTTRLIESMRDSVLLSGESFIMRPQAATLEGSTKRFAGGKGNGVIALTQRQLIFQMLIGRTINIEIDDIKSVSQNVWFGGSYHGGVQHLIINLKDGSSYGFIVSNHREWMSQINNVIGHIQ